MSCNNHSLQQENDKLRELISLYRDYIDFLNKNNESPVSVAFSHGWRCEQSVVVEGVERRAKIKQLSEEII